MTVDGGAGDTELGSDLRDGVFPLTVHADLLVHRPCHFYLSRTKFRLATPGPVAGTSSCKAFSCAFRHQRVFDYVDNSVRANRIPQCVPYVDRSRGQFQRHPSLRLGWWAPFDLRQVEIAAEPSA